MGSGTLLQTFFMAFLIIIPVYICIFAVKLIIMSTIALNLKMQVSDKKDVGTPLFL